MKGVYCERGSAVELEWFTSLIKSIKNTVMNIVANYIITFSYYIFIIDSTILYITPYNIQIHRWLKSSRSTIQHEERIRGIRVRESMQPRIFRENRYPLSQDRITFGA